MSKAIYAFSGDPVTLGHLDIIERAARVFDELIVGIGVNPGKKYLFSLEERASLARKATAHLSNIQVISFKGLLVDYAYEHNIPTIIRGLRNNEDFNFELMLHQIGESQQMKIDTFFIPSRQELSHISSGAAKAIQMEQGLIHEYVPLNVKQQLEERLSGQYILGVTGETGAGKSYVCEKLKDFAQAAGIEAHRIDIDRIGHDILEVLTEPLFVSLRMKISEAFGKHLLKQDGFINSKELGKIIFADLNKLHQFNDLIYQPLLLRLRRALYGKKGLLLLDSALIAESRMTYLCNNHVLLVRTTAEEQLKRLRARGYTDAQIREKLAGQFNEELKLKNIEEEIRKSGCGKLYKLDNPGTGDPESLKEIMERIISSMQPNQPV